MTEATRAVTDISGQQRVALNAIAAWWRDDYRPQVFRLFGYAGTGKTTIARLLPGLLDEPSVAYAAFTGKAASVLRQKRCNPASTIHQLIYQPVEQCRDELRKLRRAIARCTDHAERLTLEIEAARLEEELSKPGFVKRPGALDDIALLVIDEVSMIDDQMGFDLLSFGKPILALGDPAQLPPVNGGSEGFFMREPANVLLTEVHRQQADSPVLDLATRIREHRGTRPADYATGPLPLAAAADDNGQVLVGRNATRWDINTRVRRALGRQFGRPEPGDRIVCLCNNRNLDIYNGQVFTVLDTAIASGDPDAIELKLAQLVPDAPAPEWIRASLDGFIDEQTERAARQRAFRWKEKGFFTWAYALTTHKAQGSQWRFVFVVDESHVFREDAVRWLYTGVTRASDAVTLGSADNFR